MNKKTSQRPTISVILPTHNRAHLLPDTIRSIVRQTFEDWELVIVDDASTDNTPQVAQEFAASDSRIRYHRNKTNQGPAVSRNTAIQHAKGAYIALQDDDDISLPHRLATQIDYLQKNPRIHMVASLMATFNEQGVQPNSWGKGWRSYVKKLPPIERRTSFVRTCIGTILGRAHLFKVHPYRSFFRRNEDYDVLMRCIERANVETIDDVLYHYRKDDKTTNTQTAKAHAFLIRQYHCLVWASAYHRHRGWRDPIDNAHAIDDAISNFHPQFKTDAFKGLEKLTEELSHYLLNTPQRKAIDDTSTFIAHFADKQLASYLIGYAIALCLFMDYSDKLHFFTEHKDPLQLAYIRKCTRAISINQWREHLQDCIRHDVKSEYLRLLRLSYRSHNGLNLLRISHKILFACVRRQRLSFIKHFLKACLQIKP